MKLYEVFTILESSLSESEVNEFADNMQKLLEEEGIKLNNREVKINQRLAYPIKHRRAGHFVRLGVSAGEATDVDRKLNERLGANEKVIRRVVVASQAGRAEPAKESVIDQLRRQERVERRAAERPDATPSPSSTTIEHTIEQPAPGAPADIEAIDKKIEELLK